MASGLLAEAFDRARVDALPDNDWRHAHPDFTENLDANLSVVSALRAIADRHGVPVPAVAVAWTLAWPGITAAIVGARHPDQISGWEPAVSLELTDEDIGEVTRVLERTGAGDGPAMSDLATPARS